MLRLPRPIWVLLSISILLCSSALSQSGDFHVRYSTSYGPVFAGLEQVATADSGTVFVGFQNVVYSQETAGLMVMRTDHYGNVLWAKAITTGGQMGYGDPSVCVLGDGSIAVAVNVDYVNNNTSNYNILLVKLSCQGEILWSHSMAVGAALGTDYLEPQSLREGAPGDLLLSFYDESANPLAAISRIDASGNIVWSQTFYGPATNPNVSPNISDRYTPVAFYQNNSVTVLGLKNEYENAINYSQQIFAMQLNYNDGSVVKEQSYNYSEINTGGWGYLETSSKSNFNVAQQVDGTYAIFGIFSNFSQTNEYLYRFIINPDLTVNQAQTYSVPYTLGLTDMGITVLPNGETHIFAPDYDDGNIFYWYAADNANNVIREVTIPFPPLEINGGVGRGVIYPTGVNQRAYVANLYDPSNNGWYIDVTQATNGGNAIASCLGSPATFVTGPQSFQITTGAWNWTSVVPNRVGYASQTYTIADMPVSKEYLCSPTAAPAGFSISGPAVVCAGGNDAYTFQVNNSAPADKPVQWSIDPTYAISVTTVNDSTVSIIFKSVPDGPYEVKLSASGGNCPPVQASLNIVVDPGPDLPRYVTICTKPVTLHPGYWFESYQWQDGSTDSVYTISKAGRYTLQLGTNCGGTITDTVDAYDNRIGGLGPVTLCGNDTATLQVPGGLLDYSWGPANTLTELNDSTAEVYPSMDMTYYFSCNTVDGCHLSDTIVVNVWKSPLVRLGDDTVICSQDQLVLNAGAGYKSYVWSTGSDSSAITVGPPGTYSVLVVDAHGCKAGDTIVIQGKSCTEMLAVPNAFSPDGNGVNDIFKPHIEGRLDEYFFAVYNRWGEIEFSTHDPSVGWDGRYGGVTQSAGTYAWICRFKFSNQGLKVDKGTVILVR